MPPDTLALADIHLDQLRATPLYAKLNAKNLLPGPKEVRAEIDELLLASDGRGSVTFARGRFAEKPPGGEFTLIGDKIAVAGSADMMHAAIERSKRGGSPPPIVALLEALHGSGEVWAVSNGWPGFSDAEARQMGNAANLNRVLRSVQTASLTADFGSGMHMSAAADCPTQQDAQNLADSLRGLLGMIRLSIPPRQPDLQRAFDAIQVQPAGRSIHVAVDLAPQLATQLVDGMAGR